MYSLNKTPNLVIQKEESCRDRFICKLTCYASVNTLLDYSSTTVCVRGNICCAKL